MDKFNDNKATPSNGHQNEANDDFKDENERDLTPEVGRPDPSVATPDIPTEMPARDIR